MSTSPRIPSGNGRTAQGVKQAHRPTSAPVQYRPEVSPPPNPEPVIVANQCTVRLRPAAPVWQSHRPCLVLPAGGHSYISSDPSSGTGSGTFCWSRSYAKPRRSRRAPVSKPKRKTLEKARSAHHRTHRGCCHVLHISDALWTLLNDSLWQRWHPGHLIQLLLKARPRRPWASHRTFSDQAGCFSPSDNPVLKERNKLPQKHAPQTHRYHMSRPGPKSRSDLLLPTLILQSISLSQAAITDARVAGIVARPAGASHATRITSSNTEAKHREQPDTLHSGTPYSFQKYEHLTRTGKRSYHRAVRRATLQGSTTYRGRHHTVRTLGATPTALNASVHSTSHTTPRQPHRPPTANRCRIVSWNTGGLTSTGVLEIETWLENCQQQGSPVHLCILTETHWSFTSEWNLRSYHAVHTGISNRKSHCQGTQESAAHCPPSPGEQTASSHACSPPTKQGCSLPN